MRMVLKAVISLILLSSLMVSAYSKDADDKYLEIQTPSNLQPYTNVEAVIETLGGVIELLGTAKFENKNNKYFEKACNRPRNHSVFRGYQLAKTAYFLFTSKMERGWYDPDPLNAIIGNPDPALHHPRRIIISRIWTPAVLRRAVNLSKRLKTLPQPVKSDLVGFLSKLRSYRIYHDFLSRRPDQFKWLKGRIDETCEAEKDIHYRTLLEGKISIFSEHGNATIDVAKAKYELGSVPINLLTNSVACDSLL